MEIARLKRIGRAHSRPNRSLLIAVTLLTTAVMQFGVSAADGEPKPTTTPQWIWSPVHKSGGVPNGACFFRRSFTAQEGLPASLDIAADDTFEVYVNGRLMGRGQNWKHFTRYDLTPHISTGLNAVAVKVVNRTPGDAGLAAQLMVGGQMIFSDHHWKCSTISGAKWQRTKFADARWKPAQVLGAWGKTDPWIMRELPTPKPKLQLVSTGEATPEPKANGTDKPKRKGGMLQAALNDGLGKRLPGVLKPLEKNFPWLRKDRPVRAKTSTEAVALPNAPQAIPRKPAPKAATPSTQVEDPQYVASAPGTTAPKPSKAEPQAKAAREATAQIVAPAQMPAPPEQVRPTNHFVPQQGFAVEQVMSGARTGSLISATFNEFGQVLAGQEDGPLILMLDSNGDDIVDDVRPYCTKVKNCHGILALSGMVFAIAEGPDGTGLYRLSDEDHNGDLEDVKLLVEFEVESAEHGPHGIVLGPDGKLYIAVGNHAKLKGEFSKLSPRRNVYEGDLIPRYEDPGGHAAGIRKPGGFILRTDINGNKKELFASGLRNAYDLAFNAEGQLFTWDSDMESDSMANWYRPTRFYHVVPGSEFGWRSGWAKWPSYFHDSIPPAAETGRGSPTGMVFYQHHLYPRKYQDTIFMADWSEGRIVSAKMDNKGGSYSVKTETFLEGKPLNATDIEVGPDGMLYFVTGGRGTSGGLFRVKWNGLESKQPPTDGIRAALNAPQINSSWGRQAVAGIQQRLGPTWNEEIVSAVVDTTLKDRQRIQSLQLMQWVGPIPGRKLLLKLSTDKSPAIRRAAAYLMASSRNDDVALRLLDMLSDPQPEVRRQACEALVRNHRSVPFEFVAPLLSSQDTFEAHAARQLLSLDHPAEWMNQALATDDVRAFVQAATTLMTAWPSPERGRAVVKRAQELMGSYVSDDDFIDMLRLLQITVLRGELKPADVPQLATMLAEEFPANHSIINRELMRLLVRLQVTSIKDRYLSYLNSDIPPSERIHVVTHLRFLEAEWTAEEKLILFKHLTPPANAGNSVAGYLQNVGRELGKTLDPADDRLLIQKGHLHPAAALEAVLRMPEKLTPDQIDDLRGLDKNVTSTDETSTKLHVAVLAILARDGQPESMAYLREVYDSSPQRRVEVAIGLAEHPGGENWDYVVGSLPLVEGDIARELLTQLASVARRPGEAEPYRQVIMSGLRLGQNGATDAIRLLELWQGLEPAENAPPWNEALKAWQNWYSQTWPNAPTAKLTQSTTPQKWDYTKLLEFVSRAEKSNEGSIEKGKLVFSKAKCASCHRHGSLGESMGPDLTAIEKRFLTKEVLDSIIYPSRVISDQYKAKTLVTDEGKSYTGIVGSGGLDDFVVLQLDGTKTRVPRASVEQTVPSKISAMPEGLMDNLEVSDVIDLLAFLRSTGDEPTVVADGEKGTSTR